METLQWYHMQLTKQGAGTGMHEWACGDTSGICGGKEEEYWAGIQKGSSQPPERMQG